MCITTCRHGKNIRATIIWWREAVIPSQTLKHFARLTPRHIHRYKSTLPSSDEYLCIHYNIIGHWTYEKPEIAVALMEGNVTIAPLRKSIYYNGYHMTLKSYWILSAIINTYIRLYMKMRHDIKALTQIEQMNIYNINVTRNGAGAVAPAYKNILLRTHKDAECRMSDAGSICRYSNRRAGITKIVSAHKQPDTTTGHVKTLLKHPANLWSALFIRK